MKLSNRELDVVESIGRVQEQKKTGLIVLVVVLAVYWVLRYTGVLQSVEIPFDSLLVFYLAIQIGNTFGYVRIEDRSVELLRRYVNNDADTLAALSKRKEAKA